MKRFTPFATLIGIVLFVLILSRVDLKASLSILRGAHPSWIILAFLFLAPEILFKSMRIHHLASETHHPLKFTDSVRVYMSGQPLANVTPAKLGDVARVLLITEKSGMNTPHALAVHVADKVLDSAALALLASIGLISLISESRETGTSISALAGIGVGAVLMSALLNPAWVKRFVKPVVLALAPDKVADNLHSHGREFYQNFETLFFPLRRLAYPMLLSILAWEVAIVRGWFCAQALSLSFPLLQLQWLLPVVAIVELLPLSIMGFGTREAALFVFFAGLAKREALIPFSLLMLLVGPLTSALLGIPASSSLKPAPPRRT